MAKSDKEAVRAMLRSRDFEGIERWARRKRGPFRILGSLIFEDDELMRWRAIEAFGRAAGTRDVEEARDLVRRQIWSMTEESGATSWYATETIGAILMNVPALIKEFGPLMAAYFLESPFERGAYFAAARAAEIEPGLFSEIKDQLEKALSDADPHIRAYAGLALSFMGELDNVDEEVRESLEKDETLIRIYDFNSGELEETSVARVVKPH